MKITKDRYIKKSCCEDLKDKLVFVGGPRQVGKTTFALTLLGTEKGRQHSAYLNWDIDLHRRALLKGEIPSKPKLIVFDEIHKYARWRKLLKGFYDQFFPYRTGLVIGSARLDYYRKGGDSLQGRYHYYRLHPYSLREINKSPSKTDLQILLEYSGFPEPLSKQDKKTLRRWRSERLSRVFRGDLQDLERVNELSLLELLLEALPNKVSAPLSLQSLREDLEVSHDSVRSWLRIFENLYLTFRISPYGSPKIRAVKKEQKLYLWDWSVIPEKGARFENLVASQLLKYCHFMEDTQGYKMELRYLRDQTSREVDFVVLQDRKPLFGVECKLNDAFPSKHLSYFKERTPIPSFYQVHSGTKDYVDKKTGIRILPFITFVKELELP